MLTNKISKKISDFVYIKPRTIQEIAHLIGKNWRTADSYVEKINKESGTIGARTFRGGTRGALKIVYWNNIEKIHSYEFQETLFKRIESGSSKRDFSPFDIYQYVDSNKRHAFIETQADEARSVKQDLASEFRKSEEQVMIFSGNLTWSNLTSNNEKMIDIFEELAERKITIKILCRIDINSIDNIKKMLAINERTGRDAIEIRHAEQPLRAFIIDKKCCRFKEMKDVHDYETKKIRKKYLFYDIKDEEWVEWLHKVFWNMFRTAIPAKKRITDLETIHQL